jgi:hypothetical protein
MTKQEFLIGLKRELMAAGADSLVAENLEYYSGYIDGEIAKGRTEEDVMTELGDPRLIARSILDAAGYADEVSPGTVDDNGGSAQDDGADERRAGPKGFHRFDTGGVWLWLIPLLVTVLLLTLVILVFAGIIRLLFSPYVMPVLLVIWLIWIIRRYRGE